MCPTDLNLDTVDRAGPLCNIVTFQIKQLKASFFLFFCFVQKSSCVHSILVNFCILFLLYYIRCIFCESG